MDERIYLKLFNNQLQMYIKDFSGCLCSDISFQSKYDDLL